MRGKTNIFFASWAFPNSPVSLNSKLMVTPANMSNTTIVTTRAIRVIPF